jgi:hypothetical protein
MSAAGEAKTRRAGAARLPGGRRAFGCVSRQYMEAEA